MADQVNPGRGEEHEESRESGLFLSSEPMEGAGSPLRALGDDTDAGDTDAGDTDSDDGGPEEKGDLADGGADTDNSDESADAMDIIGDNMDGTTTKDADATDAK